MKPTPTRIAQLRAGLDNTLELGAPELREAIYLQYSNDGVDLSDCGVFIVTVPMPVDQLNQPDLGPLIEASQSVASALTPGAVVIYESTMYPGCTEEVCVPILEEYSGLQFNKDFFAATAPSESFLATGSTRLPALKRSPAALPRRRPWP